MTEKLRIWVEQWMYKRGWVSRRRAAWEMEQLEREIDRLSEDVRRYDFAIRKMQKQHEATIRAFADSTLRFSPSPLIVKQEMRDGG